MPRRAKANSCSRIAGDISRVGTVGVELSNPGRAPIRGGIFGPKGNHIYYTYNCYRRNKSGECGVWEITREGPGAKGLKPKATVGNIYGLMRQLGRDIARAWGCRPGETVGFEGSRRRRRRKRQRR